MNLRSIVVDTLFVLLACAAIAQAPPAALMPVPRIQFLDVNGRPLAGGFVYTYAAGSSTPQATFTDASGTTQNANPVPLDAGGFAGIWLGPQAYKVVVTDMSGAQQWVVDNVSDTGQLLYNLAVLLQPVNGGLQIVNGPLAATYFQGTTPHTTSPGVRVAILDPTTVLDTNNPPNLKTAVPVAGSQNYTIPDPLHDATFVLSPNPAAVNGTGNVLDCTQNGLTCKRTGYIWFDGGSCNNTTPALGFDTFGSNSPTPVCVTGTNVQKGVMAFPSAATHIQDAGCTGVGATTCVVTIPAATIATDLLLAECAVDGGKTVTGITDGTNAYSLAVAKTNGNTDLEIWYFNGSSVSVAASASLTVTLSAGANSACRFHEYGGILTAGLLDRTANNSGTGTAVTTGTTLGTSNNVELVFGAVAVPGAPTFTGPTCVSNCGWVQHTPVSQSTNISVNSIGRIQQAVATQAGAFTLGTSLAWASAIVTFKANVATNVSAQRQFSLPTFTDITRPVNGIIKWSGTQQPIWANVTLAAALACTADGSTDDPAPNTATTSSVIVDQSAANALKTTTLSGLTTTGCAAGNELHYQIQRQRYDVNDTYEGWAYVSGAALQFGITQ